MTTHIHRRIRALSVIFALVASFAFFNKAEAANPACGDTITVNTTLTADLNCTGIPGTAITIGASNVTLDGANFTISDTDSGAVGVSLASGAIVKNITFGSLAQPFNGTAISGAGTVLQVLNNTVYSNSSNFAMVFNSNSDTTISGNTINNAGRGIQADFIGGIFPTFGAPGLTLSNNTFNGNGRGLSLGNISTLSLNNDKFLNGTTGISAGAIGAINVTGIVEVTNNSSMGVELDNFPAPTFAPGAKFNLSGNSYAMTISHVNGGTLATPAIFNGENYKIDSAVGQGISLASSNFVTFKDLVLGSIAIPFNTGSYPILIAASDHTMIDHLNLYETTPGGFDITVSGGSDFKLLNSNLHGAYTEIFNVAGVLAQNNTMDGIGYWGFNVSNSSDLTFRGNTMTNFFYYPIYVDGVTGTEGIKFIDNNISGATTAGVRVANASHVSFNGDQIHDNPGHGLLLYSITNPPQFSGNINLTNNSGSLGFQLVDSPAPDFNVPSMPVGKLDASGSSVGFRFSNVPNLDISDANYRLDNFVSEGFSLIGSLNARIHDLQLGTSTSPITPSGNPFSIVEGSNNAILDHVTIYSSGVAPSFGVTFSNVSNATLRNSNFHKVNNNQILNVAGANIEGNMFETSGSGSGFVWNNFNSSNLTFKTNMISGLYQYGIYADGVIGTEGLTITANTITGANTAGVRVGSVPTLSFFRNNLSNNSLNFSGGQAYDLFHPTFGGNFWGHIVSGQPCFFINGGPDTPFDANRPDITDTACLHAPVGTVQPVDPPPVITSLTQTGSDDSGAAVPVFLTSSIPPSSGLTRATKITFTFTAEDTGFNAGIGGIRCLLDGVETNCGVPTVSSTVTNSITYSTSTSPALTEGLHTFTVIASDKLPQLSDPKIFTFTVDRTGPMVTIDSVTDLAFSEPIQDGGFTAEGDINLTYTVKDGALVATLDCSLDGAPFAPCSGTVTPAVTITTPKTYILLAEGQHAAQLKATDSLGNVSAVATFTWTVDTTSPRTTITSAVDSSGAVLSNGFATRAPSITFKYRGEDNFEVAKFVCFLNSVQTDCSDGMAPGGMSAFAEKTYDVSSFPDGQYLFTVEAVDKAGLHESSVGLPVATFTFIIDRTPPRVNINSVTIGNTVFPVNASGLITSLDTLTFAFSAVDPLASSPGFPSGINPDGFTCSLDGVETPCTSPKAYSAVAFGPHIFKVFARDKAGNVSVPDVFSTFTWTSTDQCPGIAGNKDKTGCPAVIQFTATFEIRQQPGNQLVSLGAVPNIVIRVFKFANQLPADSPIIYEKNTTLLVGTCTTGVTGSCIAGVPANGNYLAIALFPDTQIAPSGPPTPIKLYVISATSPVVVVNKTPATFSPVKTINPNGTASYAPVDKVFPIQ